VVPLYLEKTIVPSRSRALTRLLRPPILAQQRLALCRRRLSEGTSARDCPGWLSAGDQPSLGTKRMRLLFSDQRFSIHSVFLSLWETGWNCQERLWFSHRRYPADFAPLPLVKTAFVGDNKMFIICTEKIEVS